MQHHDTRAPHQIQAEEVVGAALEMGITDELLEQLMGEFDAADWKREGNKAYPPWYCFAQGGRYRAHPEAVRKVREAIASVPRVNPEDYDILFNAEGSHPVYPGPTWDIVKWMRCPEHLGWLPGHGWAAVVLLEPYPVWGIPARRDPLSLSDWDFNQLRRNATTLRDGGKGISEELLKNNLRRQAERSQARADADLEFAEYYRDLFKRNAQELGI